jgi:hypothetical protein
MRFDSTTPAHALFVVVDVPAALLDAGFDPSQPRDEHGQWSAWHAQVDPVAQAHGYEPVPTAEGMSHKIHRHPATRERIHAYPVHEGVPQEGWAHFDPGGRQTSGTGLSSLLRHLRYKSPYRGKTNEEIVAMGPPPAPSEPPRTASLMNDPAYIQHKRDVRRYALAMGERLPRLGDAGFNPSQERDAHGQWTGESSAQVVGRYLEHMTKATGKLGEQSLSSPPTPMQSLALGAYVWRYKNINRRLRENEPGIANDGNVKHLTDLIDKSTLPHDLLTYRSPGHEVSAQLAQLDVGDTFVNPGFTSTSTSHAWAKGFAGTPMEVVIPAGSRALPVGRLRHDMDEALRSVQGNARA